MPIRKLPNILALRKKQQEKRKLELEKNKLKLKKLKNKRKKIFERPDPRDISGFEKI